MHLFCSLMIKNKDNNPIRLYQNYGSYLAEKERLSRNACAFRCTVVSNRSRSPHSSFGCAHGETATRKISLYPPPAAVDFSPSHASVARVQISPANEKITAFAVLSLAEEVVRKLNSASPTLIELKLGEFNPPEIKPLDKLEFVVINQY